MEQRLIDANAFDTKLFNDGFFGGLACASGNTPRKRKFTIGEFRGMLAKAPTVDAVLVVRCGECRCLDTRYVEEEGGCLYCRMTGRRTKLTDFCSDGEREPRTPPAE